MGITEIMGIMGIRKNGNNNRNNGNNNGNNGNNGNHGNNNDYDKKETKVSNNLLKKVIDESKELLKTIKKTMSRVLKQKILKA